MARELEIVWVDAFTTTPLQGNACAVVLDARGLGDDAMFAIAREINLSETTRCRSRLAQFLGTVRRDEIAAALRLREDDLFPGVTPQTVSTGTPQLMIALASRDALDRADPDRRALFPREREWLSVHVFARADEPSTNSGHAVALVARHFADVGDVIEDPFTGSATGGMAGYCARYGIVRERAYDVMQGMHVHRPGRAHVEVGGDPPDAIGRITVAGAAVTVMRSTMSLP